MDGSYTFKSNTATRAPAVLITFEHLKNPLSSHQLLLVRDHAGPCSHSLHVHPDESLARVFRRSLRNSLRTQGRRVVEGQVGIACMEVERYNILSLLKKNNI